MFEADSNIIKYKKATFAIYFQIQIHVHLFDTTQQTKINWYTHPSRCQLCFSHACIAQLLVWRSGMQPLLQGQPQGKKENFQF